ncbi:MAG: hypothetical protein HQL69_15470 [Magnetococcales bacterium]|nr:hypothetical protein [Magnetococcales bacterium]
MNIFTLKSARKTGGYIFPEAGMTGELISEVDYIFPMIVDTEYTQESWEGMLDDQPLSGRKGVTVQIKGIHDGPGMIYAHDDQVAYAEEIGKEVRHPILETPFAPVDYLRSCGFNDAKISHHDDSDELEGLPVFEFCLYGHFFLVELLMIVSGTEFREDVLDKIVEKKIIQGSLLKTKEGNFSNSVKMPWKISIGGHDFSCNLVVIDTVAIHGNTSYENFCLNSGIKLDHKGKMGDAIKRMDDAYFRHPDEFDSYALGDLRVYDALEANADNFKTIYTSLGIKEYYRDPRLTTGATVSHIFESKLKELFGVSPDDSDAWKDLSDLFYKGSAGYLQTRINTTTALLSKINGGRCRNNRPNVISLDAPLVDIDLAGCYGESLRAQIFPIGMPFTVQYDADSQRNQTPTLREFLDSMKWDTEDCQLVPGLWVAIVSTEDDCFLKYRQDFVASWFDYVEEDTTETHISRELDNKSGTLKIFYNEIKNGVIGHDFVQWLFFVCCQEQRDELLDSLYIQTAILYPACERCSTTDELQKRVLEHDGVNTCSFTFEAGGSARIDEVRECFAWYGVDLDKFIVDDLMVLRGKNPKPHPLNTLYKLCVNTFYGISTSSYFKTSNVVVGNSITARARSVIYYAEKGLDFVQTITDGGVFELNKVVYPGKSGQIVTSDLVCLYDLDEPNVSFAPLGACDDIQVGWDGEVPVIHLKSGGDITIKRGKEALEWVNNAAWLHLQDLFPRVDVLHKKSTKIDVGGGGW